VNQKYKVLITGGAGFIGSHIAESYLAEGHEVIIVDNLSTGLKENIPVGAKFFAVDICDSAKLEPLFAGIDVVSHQAALPRNQYCVEHPEECHRHNVDGTLSVLRLARLHGVKKVIYASSCAIYAESEQPISEDHPIKPRTPYAVQKYIGELYGQVFQEIYGLPIIILRYFNVYGAGQNERGAYPNVLAAFRKQIREVGKVFITGDGEQKRDYVHVKDVAEANVKALDLELLPPWRNALNIGTGRPLSVNEVASFFGVEKEYIQPRPGEPRILYADISRAKKILHWEPKIRFEEGVQEVVAEYAKDTSERS